MDLLDPLGDLRRGDGVAQTPAGDRVGLGEGGAGDGTVPHTGEGGEIGVLEGRVDDMLIDFVGNHISVVLLRKACDNLQLFPGKNSPAGVGGIAENQSLGLLPERVLQRFGVKMEVRRGKGDIDGFRAGEDGIGPVILVEGGENDHLVPWIGDGHHGGHHRLGAAAGDGDFAVGVDGPSHQAGLLFSQGLPEILRAPGDGILMEILRRDFCQTVQNGFWGLEVREAL